MAIIAQAASYTLLLLLAQKWICVQASQDAENPPAMAFLPEFRHFQQPPCAIGMDCDQFQTCVVIGGQPTCVDKQPRPGQCPVPNNAVGPPWDTQFCIADCNNDYNCRGAMKCCKNRCGQSCTGDINGGGGGDLTPVTLPPAVSTVETTQSPPITANPTSSPIADVCLNHFCPGFNQCCISRDVPCWKRKCPPRPACVQCNLVQWYLSGQAELING